MEVAIRHICGHWRMARIRGLQWWPRAREITEANIINRANRLCPNCIQGLRQMNKALNRWAINNLEGRKS